MRRIVLSALAALAVGWAGAAPLSADEEARAHRLAQSLRSPVCQNQTIAESNAPLAQDLREQVQAQVAAGRSDAEVREFMVRRFGDFVLYEPPRTPQTLLLWLGPFALLGGGALVLWRQVRRRAGAAATGLADDAAVAVAREGGG